MGLLQKIVRNESMKDDPKEIYNWRVFVVCASACFGGMLFGMDTGIIGGVLKLDPFRNKYNLPLASENPTLSANLEANIVSTLQAGCFLGAIVAGWVADKLGRRIGMMIAAVLAIIGSVMQAAAAGHFPVMYIGRFVAGVGVGGASMITPLYTSENAPRAIRGALTGMYQFFIVTGVCIAFWINYGSLLHFSGTVQYVVPLALQTLPAVILLVGMFISSETPRWLARQDRWEDAGIVLARVRNLPQTHPYVQNELQEMSDQLAYERRLVAGSGIKDLLKEMFTIPGNRKRTLISIGLMICQQMTGTNAINYYAPQIFSNLGLTGTESSLFATGIYGVLKMVGCALFLLLAADSLGRRRSLLWTSIAQGLCMYYIGIYIRVEPPQKGVPVPAAGYVAIVAIYLFAVFFQFGWGPVCWIYVSEIPTARLRALNVSIAAATQWLFNFVVARATPNMIATVGKGGYGAYFIYGTFCFCMFIFTWVFVPETKGRSLESMDELFGKVPDGKAIDEEAHDIRRGSSPSQKGADITVAHVEKS
ncbi:Putative major facilitator, sugar transporter, major facilitator superfamily [Septoria linicola]|uniref:Major facilitator, sugar transporter, major facilitator superfamily n=1 Tax=Septoria linicola TaxID=215465 RepID=A0A9Q9ELU0_9PEZI|nr:putative major facilitator, sugar transporter, major facilitator superfamily [Septoria linicola]USW54719.1 Putative major facilitator, sugar transporter, major facilitator superfamily [Septoria linicola]